VIFLLDIGNTCLHLGLARRPGEIAWHRTLAPGSGRFHVSRITALDRKERITGVAISSVVPELTREFVALARSRLGLAPVVLDSRTRTGLELRYRPAASLGPDRIANAVAAHYLYRGDALAVDMGTATTIDVVTTQGVFLGGAILPGLGTMLDALSSRTARLPALEPGVPRRALGRTTRENILSGAFHAHFAGINRIIRAIEQETGRKFKIVVTGGLSSEFGRAVEGVSVINPLLTLQGLSIAFHYHTNRRSRVLTRHGTARA
jgi:type III pantothenate kinase